MSRVVLSFAVASLVVAVAAWSAGRVLWLLLARHPFAEVLLGALVFGSLTGFLVFCVNWFRRHR